MAEDNAGVDAEPMAFPELDDICAAGFKRSCCKTARITPVINTGRVRIKAYLSIRTRYRIPAVFSGLRQTARFNLSLNSNISFDTTSEVSPKQPLFYKFNDSQNIDENE